MNFKLDEIHEIDEEETTPPNEDDQSENEAHVPYGFDDNDESEDANRTADASEEPKDDDDEDGDDDDIHEIPEDLSTLILKQRISVPHFNQNEEDNFAYAEAVMAYYEEKNYEVAIEKFDQAIKKEKRGKRVIQLVDNEIVAKSLYWQAESYVKTQDIAKAIKTFEYLVKTCKEHYLTLSAQRRADILKAKQS